TSADQGVHTFTLTLKRAGRQTVTIVDKVTASLSGTAVVTVAAAAASSLSASGYPSPTTAGNVGNLTVTALDAYGHTAAGYSGTVHVTSSDSQAVLPANYTFTAADAGKHVFSITLKTTGTQSLTATDTASSALTGSQTGIVINPAGAASLSI